MSVLRKLAGQTAIYGLSSIVARFLNFLLTPLYTSKGVFPPAEFGVMTSLYAWAPFISIVLTFGMETAYFRFANKATGDDRTRVRHIAMSVLAHFAAVHSGGRALRAAHRQRHRLPGVRLAR